MDKEKLFGDLYSEEDDSIIKDNWITPEDIMEYVKEFFKNALPEEFQLFNMDKAIDKLKEVGIPIIELRCPSSYLKEIRVKTFSEYLRYLEIKKPAVIFLYVNTVDYSKSKEDILDLYSIAEAELEDCGILQKIKDMLEDFVNSHSIMSQELEIVDENQVSLSYKADTSFMDNLRRNLNYLGEKLRTQKEIYEELQEDMLYNKAMEEVKYLYSYLIINGDFLACKTEKQCKLYKEKGKYLNDDRFKNLKFMIDNKPVVNSEKYRKFKMLYVELEDTFERARRFVKGENK